MRTIYSYIVYIILLLQLNSCNNEGLMYEYEHSTPIKFSSSCINVSTKSQGIIENNKLPKGSNISIFSIQHPENTTINLWEPILFDNIKGISNFNGDIEYNNNYDVAKKYEIENEIDKELFDKLIKNKISNIIEKTRIKIPIENNLKVEIDIYYDYLEGLLTAEIEFPNEELANKFQKQAWLGKELGYKKLSNRKLAEMTKDEWQKEVTKEMIENNNIIIKQLKDNYNIK